MHDPVDSVNLLGIKIDPLTMSQTVDTLKFWICERQLSYICVTSVNSIIECLRHEKIWRIYNLASLVVPDGMPLVWLSRFKGQPNTERIYGPDLMLAMCEVSQTTGFRHFFYGSNPHTLTRLQNNLKQRFPKMQIAGAYAPPFRPLTAEEDENVITMINQVNPDIVWVGLGMPKQEIWMAGQRARLTAPILIGVGAAFDFHAGTKPQAPRWMQRSGLEWFFRLITEPRRLWKRYLIGNTLFILYILAEWLGIKRFPKS